MKVMMMMLCTLDKNVEKRNWSQMEDFIDAFACVNAPWQSLSKAIYFEIALQSILLFTDD
jgi:hypothetical protein